MTQKRHRAGAQVAEIDGAVPPALHRWHPRSVETTSGQPHYAENCRLLDDYRAPTATPSLRVRARSCAG